MPYPKYLIGKVATRRNLKEAWEDVSRSARPFSRGLSNQTIQDFKSDPKANLEQIRDQLLQGAYSFGLARAQPIQKGSNGKRPLRIADVRDRVVQRAIAKVLERELSKQLNMTNPASFAYIPGRGVQAAIARMLSLHLSGSRVILEADIVDFFGTVDIQRLLGEMVFPLLPDPSINRLVQTAVAMEIGNKDNLPEEDWELYPESSSGLPQGGYLSPLLSNVYLSSFDEGLLGENFGLIRYADDFIVMCRNIAEAENAFVLCEELLGEGLGLAIHPRVDNDRTSRTKVVRVSQIPIKFLGVEFNGARIWPAGSKRQKLSNKMTGLKDSKDVRSLLNSMSNLLEGWIAAYGFTDINPAYVRALDEEVNKNLWSGLNRLGWRLQPKPLSRRQRQKSGVKPVAWHLHNIRTELYYREVFEQYWTN